MNAGAEYYLKENERVEKYCQHRFSDKFDHPLVDWWSETTNGSIIFDIQFKLSLTGESYEFHKFRAFFVGLIGKLAKKHAKVRHVNLWEIRYSRPLSRPSSYTEDLILFPLGVFH